MKIKVQKAQKRNTAAVNGEEVVEVQQDKQAKVTNGEQNEQKDAKLNNGKPKEEKLVKNVDNTIFQHFKNLTSEEEKKRMDAALLLLQQLSKTKEPEKRKIELAYALKRLVRGCGASTNTSRAGFFTGLVAFLRAFKEEEVPMAEVFATMQKELHVGATIANKEDADAVVGKILVCGAILHSERSKQADSEQLEKITDELLHSSRYRTYHASLGYSFLIELIETLTVKQFGASVWPLLQKELQKSWPKQTLQTVHCLIAAQKKFPSVVNEKFMKAHLGGVELLNDESFTHLYKLFWDHSNSSILTHPGFELFGSYIGGCKKLTEFWTETVDPGLKTPTKLLEIETLKIATDILNNLNVEITNVVDLLSTNFMKMFVEGLKTLKQKKDDTLSAFYTEFLDALVACCSKLQQDTQKVAVIRRLLLPPGAFNIEKYTHTRIIHQIINSLSEQGIKDIYSLYKDIFIAKLPKNMENMNEKWLNFERMNAGYMLQHLLAHKSVQNAYKWREQELTFFLNAGLFYVTDSMEICKKETAGTFSTDFGEQCKNLFYTSLQSKLHDLHEEKNLLLQLVNNCNERMQRKNASKFIRLKAFDDGLQKSWQSMYQAVSSDNDNTKASKKKTKKQETVEQSDKLELVFHILLLNMGLQLFREHEMAAPAIDDLLKCMQRTKEQQKDKKQTRSQKAKTAATEDDVEEEPAWIEVLMDLFLHLLSQNASALRNIVNALFPHFCSNLNLNAVHQVLAVLDMKDGHNPLSTKAEALEEDEESEEEENENEMESDAAEKEEESGDEADSDDEDDEDEDDDEEDEDEDDDEVSASDKLRNAISQALIENGGIAKDDDMESIDLNDLTEEEGNRLDEALANAFKAIKKTPSGAQSKKSKSYRVQTTTVMHFRIRVLDLIEIYLQHQPTLLISIEIMLALYDMLEHCVAVELKPLQNKVEKVLNKLTAHKTYPIDADLSEDNLVNFIRLIVEKKTPAVAYEVTNRLRNKCIIFLIGSANKIGKTTNRKSKSQVLDLCAEYLQDFVKNRNPIVNITLLSDILKLRWLDVWQLGTTLAEQVASDQTRTFRRIQIYELFLTLYKNFDLHRLDLDVTKRSFKSIEQSLTKRIQTLTTLDSNKQSPKEFQTLLELLLQIHRSNVRLELKSSLSDSTTFDAVQNIRRLIRLETAHVYQRYCSTFKLTSIRNSDLQTSGTKPPKQQNGLPKEGESSDDEETQDLKGAARKVNTAPKRKHDSNNDARKLKKEKKLKRLEAASLGLNGGVPFGQATAVNGDEDSA